MAFNITAIMNVALASGAATKISRDINRALQNKRVNVDLSLANPDSIKRIKADIEGAITSVESFGRQAGLAAKRFGAFSLAAGSMITLVSAIKSSTSEAIAFDREMVRLGQVSNDSVASIQAVGNEVTRLSVSLGVSSKDLIGAAVTLKQANLSINDTKIALEALAKAALAPNFENFANTTQGAIAVLNQFKIGAAGLESALGSINAVAGEYAVEASDLVEVIRKTGGAFKSAGGDLNELLALFTSVRQTTRESAETISTGLRTIFTRIQRGQTIESLKELGIQLRYTSQEAAALGNIKLADQFVGPYEAVRRLSEALAGIPTTSGKYSAIVEELGGYRQISKVIPLLQEFSVSQGALNVALGGSSSLAANAAQAQNAYIIKIQKIKEEFNALIRSVTQSSGFQKIFDTFISGASAAIQLADALKFLLPLITAIAAVKLATSFGQFVKGFATGVTASPNPKIFNQNRVAEGGYIKMKNGGVVPGSGSGDKVKTLLEPGELVIPKKYVGGGPISVSDMPSLAIQRKLNDPKIEEADYKSGKTINKQDKFKYEIVTINIDGGVDSTTGTYIEQGQKFEIQAARQLKARWISKDKPDAPVDLEKNGFPYEVKNVSSPVRNKDIVDKLARYRLESFGDRYFTNSSGVEDIDLGQIGLVYNTQKINANSKAFEGIQGKEANEENERTKSYASLAKDGTRTFQDLNIRKARKLDKLNKSNRTTAASGGFMIPGTGNTDSFPMDLDEGSFVVRKSSVAKLGAENLHSMSRKGYAKGGKVPALLMPGEFVFSPSSAKSIGSANLERMNKHAKFAAGGRVGLAEGGNPNPIGEEAYSVASQTKIKIPNFQKIQEFANSFPDLTAAQESLRKIILEEVNAFSVNLSEAEKLAEASRIATDIMRRYEDIDKAIKAQEDVIANRSSTATQPEIDADAKELRFLKRQRGKLTKEVGLSSTVLPTGDAEFRTKIGSEPKPEIGKGKEYDYAKNEKVNISDEIRNRARERAVKISPSGDGENIASVTKIRLALEEEGKLRNQAIQAIGQQLRITTGITDKQVLLEMATEKFTIAMQQNAKLAKDSEGRLRGLASLEQDILDSGRTVDNSMRGVSIELKEGASAFGKLKLIFRNIGDAIEGAGNEVANEFRMGGGGIRGTFAAIRNSKTLKVAAGVATAAVGIGGQYLASTGGTAEDVSKGAVSEGRYVASAGIGEALNQGATAAIALSMIPVAGPFLAVIGGATAGFFGLIGAVKKAQIELMKVQVDKKAKEASEKISELKNFSGVEREQKGLAAFTNVRSTVFAIRQTATAEGVTGPKLEDEIRAKSLEKFGSNLGAISEELSNAIANMVKPDDKRKSEDIYNEFKQTSYGQLAIESLGVASGKSTIEVQKHALALASSAITAKKLEDAQKNSIVIHEKMNLRMSVLTNSINLASESFRNISESMVNFSDILEGRSEFKIQQNASKLKIGTDEKIFNKETDRAFLPFGKEGDNLKNQAKELNAFALNLPAAFDTAKETVRNNKTGDIGVTTEEILKKQLGMKQEDRFTSTQQDLIDLFKGQIQNEQKNKPDLGGISGEKITKDALGQAISQMEQLLQSNMQSVNQVSQQYISGLRRISDEQKKYIQELDRVAEKTLSVNKAQANIDAAKVRGNPEDFLTREQRIAPFVQKQINVTQGAVNRGAIQAKDIQDPQAIFKAITDAQAALIDSDKKLQEENAKLASANKGDAEAARKAALENNNLRDNISTLGEALRNLRDDTVMLAEAESRLTQAEKDRENKLSVTENLLTMDRAGKRNLRRGKEAAEQVAGGANLEDMSPKQRKAFFDYVKLYGNIKLPGLGGKTGEQVRQVGLERAAGGFELGVGKENEAANKAREDILKIEKTREEAAKKYADLLKGNDQANVDALKKVGDNFITELQNMLARENDRNLKGQIAVEDVKMDKLTQIKDDKNYQQYTNIIGQGANKDNREKQFSSIFSPENLKAIVNKRELIKTKEDMQIGEESDAVRDNRNEDIKKLKLELLSMTGPFGMDEVKDYLPSGGKLPAGKSALQTPDLLLIAERMRGVGTSIEKLPKAIDDLALIIKDMKGRLINPPPVANKANGGFIGRSMGGSIYNNPTKDIAQKDQYPTLLSRGEFVMNEGAARNNRPELEAMNKGHKVNYFAEGTSKLTQADIEERRKALAEKIAKTEADIAKNKGETRAERARIANNKASMTGSSVKKTEGVQGEGISEGTYLAQKRFDGLDYNEESGIAKKVNIFKDVPETRSIRTQYSSYPYKDRDGIFNRKDFIDTFGEKNADYSNDAEDIAWEAFKKFEFNTNQPKKFPRTFIPVSERVNPIGKEDIDSMMDYGDKLSYSKDHKNSPEKIAKRDAFKKDYLANIKKMEESKEYKEKELKVKEKYNLTDLKMPEGFKFEGYEKHLDKIRPDRTTEKKGRPDEDITDVNDVKYTIADIRFEFERAVSDLAYVNAESRKLSKNENIAEDVVGRLTYSKDTWKDISNPAASLKQIKEDADKFDYEDEFFHHLKDITPRYPFSYGDAIDPSISNDIKAGLVYGLRDTWKKVGGSYGTNINPMVGKEDARSIANQIKLRQEQKDEYDKNDPKSSSLIKYPQRNPLKDIDLRKRDDVLRLYPAGDKNFESPIGGEDFNVSEQAANYLEGNLKENSLRHKIDSENSKEFEKKYIKVQDKESGALKAGQFVVPNKNKFNGVGFKLPQMNLDTGKFEGKENTNQQESDILIDLIKQAREQKKQALAQNIENIKKKVNAQIEAESSLTKGIPLKGVDAKLAKTNQNLYARIANPRLSDDKLPFPVQGFRGEFTPEAEAAPVTRPTIAMQEAKAKQNEIFNAGAGEREENRQFQAANLTLRMREEAERHGDFSREASSLYKEENKSFVGPLEDPQDKIKKIMAFKKSQIQSGNTDPLAQRLHTQIAKTIASYKEPKMDFNHPEVYERYLKQVDISKLGDVKKLSSVSLKAYADENIPVLNPAIMALQEYYDSVDQRRFGFNNTEDFARTIQNKNIELAAKMDREAAMLLARKVRGEVKVEDSSSEVSPIGDGPRKDAARLTNIYRDYHHSLGKKWLGTPLSPDNLNNPLEFTNGMSGFEPHDNDEKDKNYHDAYDRSRAIIKDLANVDSHRSDLGYARPFYEKVKQEQAALENFIKSKIDYKKLGIRAFMDLRKDDPQEHTDKQIKEDRSEKLWREIQALPFTDNPIGKIKNQSGQVINVPKNRAEAAKVIAEEQAKPAEQAKPPVIPMPAQESKPVVAADQTKPKISPEEMMNKLFNEGQKEGKAVLDFNKNGIRIQGSPEQEKEYATVQTYLNSPTYRAMKILQDKIDNIKLKQNLDIVKDSTVYPENAELSDTIYLRWLNEQVSTLKSQDIISEPYKAYIKLVTGKIGEKFIDFKSSGGPVAYRSFGGGVGGVDAMLTPGEMVISPEKAAENEGVLRHINNGGDVKNFNFGGRVRRGRSFRVPAYAPNPDPERFEKVGSDSVAAPGLAAGSFVVNARDTAKNLPFLQHLASGGSVGYYQKGGGLDKKDFNLLGYPTDENLDFSKARTALMERVYGNAELKATLKEYAGGKSQGLEDLLQEIVSEHFHKNKIGRIGAVRNRQTALYDAIMPGYNNIDPANFKSFLSGNALENTEKQYRDLVNKKSDKDLQNLPALNAELNSPFKPSKPISEQESLDKETGRLNRESNRTEIEKLKIKLSQLKQDPFNPKVNAEYDRVSALIEKKEKKSRDMIGYPLKEEEDDGGAAAEEERLRNEKIRMTTANRIPIAIRKMQLDRLDIFDPDKIMEIQQLQEEISILEGNPKDLARTAYIDELARRKRLSPEQKNQEALDKETRRQNRESNRTEVENLRTKRDQIKLGSIDPKDKNNIEHKRISDLIEEKEAAYIKMIAPTPPRLKKEDFGLLPQAPGFANGGTVGYYEDGGFSNFKRFEGYGSSSGLSTLTTPIVNEALKNQYKPQMSGMVNNDQSFTNNSSDINTKNGLEMALDFGADESSSKDLKKIIEDLLTKQDFSKKMRTSSLKGYANGGAVGYYAAGDVVTESDAGAAQAEKRRMEEAIKRQEEIRKINRRKNNEGSEGVIGGIRPNEMKILKGKEKPPDGKPDNRLVNELSMEELHNVINELAGEKLDVLGADKLQRARQEFANRVKKIQFNERYTQLNNALNSQKRGGKKDHTKQGEQFESFLTNNGIKGQVHTDRPFRLRDNPDIDKSYLTGIAHFEPNILSKLNDKKIETIAMNLIKKQKIKGFSGETANFNEANYFGEIGDAFNSKHTFLKMSDVIKITDLLDRQDKGRETNLNSAALGQRIKSKNPLDGLDFMLEYGQQDPERKPDDAFRTHSALTAQVSNINPDLKPDGRVNFKRNGVALLEEDLLKGRVGQEIDLTRLKKPVKKAFGGYINGASDGDTVPALLSAGEFVMPRHAVNRIGLDNLEKMRKPQRFFDGGAVGSPRASVFDKMNNVANSQSANSMDVDSLNNAAREFNKAAKSFETSMAKMEKSAKTLEGAMDKLSKVNIPENITGTIKVDNKIDLDITSSNFAMDMTTAVGKAVSDITGRLKDATDGKIDIA